MNTITSKDWANSLADSRRTPNAAVNHIAYEIAKRRPEMIEALKWDLKAMMGGFAGSMGDAIQEGWRVGGLVDRGDCEVGFWIDRADGLMVVFLHDHRAFETRDPWTAFGDIQLSKRGGLRSFLYHEVRPIRIVGHGSGAAVAACAADWSGCAATTFGCARWKEGALTSPEAQILNVVNVAVPEPYYGREALTRPGLTLHIDSRGIPPANHRTLQTYLWTLERMSLKEQS